MAPTHCRTCGAGIAEGAELCYRCLAALGLQHAGAEPGWRGEPGSNAPAPSGKDSDSLARTGRGGLAPAALEKGARFGPYEIISPLGAGGMGEVYLAEDARLGRRLALKILRADLARKVDHLQRFEREARLLASLSHPNIAALYGLEESGGVRALVMELIEGPTLHERIGGRPMRPMEAARIARQIAEALEAAHAREILHRDLKPANIKISSDGAVKVLDFGLAKILAPESSDAGIGEAPTAVDSTQPGVIMGTAPYMSPEQIRGEPLDLRTDVWAFGCVLFEMLSGRAAFSGKTASDVAVSVLDREPNWQLIPNETPAAVVRLVRRALRKDPRRRLQHIGEARAELEEILEGRGEPEPVALRNDRRLVLGSVVVAMASCLMLAYLVWRRGPATPPRSPQRVTVVLPKDIELIEEDWSRYPLAMSPGGETLYFAGRSATDDEGRDSPRLYARRLDSYRPESVPGTEEFLNLALSPDGKWGATSLPVGGGEPNRDLARFALVGGSTPVRIAAWPEGGDSTVAWLPDDTILVTTLSPLTVTRMTVDGTGRSAVSFPGIAEKGDSPWTWLGDALPDGRHVFLYSSDGEGSMGLFLLDLTTRESRIVLRNAFPAHLLAKDLLLFSRRQTLLAVRFDQDRLETVGAPVAVLDGLPSELVFRYGHFTTAANGTLAYALDDPSPRDFEIRILSREGGLSPWDGEKRVYHAMALSPDGQRIAAGVFGMRRWLEEPPMIGEVGRRQLRTLVKGPEKGDCYSPAFSPDGRFLAYRCSDGIGEDSSGGIYLRPADGRGTAEKILHLLDNTINWASSLVFSADSSRLLIRKQTAGPSPWLSLAVPAGAADAESLEEFLPAEADARDLQIAPGGTFIVYSSQRDGVPAIFARPLAPGGGLGEEIRLSPQSGHEPRLRTGPPEVEQEVVYITDDPGPGSPRIMSVRVRSGSGLTVTAPSAIPGGSVDEMRLLGPRYSILPDGSILFVQSPPDPEGPDRIQVIFNFDVEVRRKLELVERGRTS